MKPCVQAELAFSSAQLRDLALVDLRVKIIGRSTWGTPELEAKELPIGLHGIRCEIRFNSLEDQDATVNSILTSMLVHNPLSGSSLRTHDCKHDEHRTCGVEKIVKAW